jgi:hypothetical protein
VRQGTLHIRYKRLLAAVDPNEGHRTSATIIEQGQLPRLATKLVPKLCLRRLGLRLLLLLLL